MQIKSVAVACLLALVCWTVMAVPSAASAICWIDRIAKAKGGIDVYFMQTAVLRISVTENSGGTSVQYTALDGVVRDEGGHAQGHLFVRDGAEFYALQMAHDSCSFKVSASEELGKLTAKSVMNLPGLKPISTTQVIWTDGTVSQPEAASRP